MSDARTSYKNALRVLDPRKLQLRLDPFHRLHMEIGIEERYGPVHALRALPLTQPDRYISIQDDEGNEIGVISDLAQLSPESRRAVERDLELYYLTAAVRAIRKVEAKHGVISWELETDLGVKTIHVRDRQHIRPLPDGRTILTDIHQARYVIPSIETLDERSRHWLEIEM